MIPQEQWSECDAFTTMKERLRDQKCEVVSLATEDRRGDLIAATPQLAATSPHRPVWCAAAQGGSEPANTIMVIEVKKTAFLHGTTYRHVCVEVPEEGEKGKGRNVDGSTQEGHVLGPRRASRVRSRGH